MKTALNTAQDYRLLRELYRKYRTVFIRGFFPTKVFIQMVEDQLLDGGVDPATGSIVISESSFRNTFLSPIRQKNYFPDAGAKKQPGYQLDAEHKDGGRVSEKHPMCRRKSSQCEGADSLNRQRAGKSAAKARGERKAA